MRRWARWVGGAGALFTFLAAALLFVQVRARESQRRVLDALRTANGELLRAQGDRERLSRDLHDGSIQNLYGLGLHLQRVQALLPDTPRRARDELNESLAMLDQSIAELRQFILTADVDHLQQHTTVSALEGLAERVRKTAQIDFHLHLDNQAATLNPTTGVQIMNIVREAVSNALRHAGARAIEVRLEPAHSAVPAQSKRWRLSIIDDGCGFELTQSNHRGRGLKNLAARAAELHGSSEILSAPGSGTQAIVEFPE